MWRAELCNAPSPPSGAHSSLLHIALMLLLCALPLHAATHYVNVANPTPQAPYTNWASASTNIQFAINAAAAGGLILVTNGTYTGAGKSMSPYGLTMLAATNGITLRSVNGPEVTIINGLGNKRGIIISNATVEGFTITNCVGDGFLTYKGGGGAMVGGWGRLNNCVLTGNRGLNYGGAAAVFSLGIISNCVIRGNYATTAGGGICMYEGGLVVDCVISNNLASGTGGARGGGIGCEVGGVVSNCLIVNNLSHVQGGGLSIFTNGLAVNCLIAGNIANSNDAVGEGGGAYLHLGGTLLNCVLSNNFAKWQGGAVKFYYRGGLVRNCLMRDNSTVSWGGALIMRSGGRAENCTMVSNSAAEGSGVYFYEMGGTNVNCIIFGNTGGANLAYPYGGSVLYSCVPQEAYGTGNLTNDPAFADASGGDFRLSTNSPCINTASNLSWMGGATDLTGDNRVQNEIPDMGAHESGFWSRFQDADDDGLSDGDEASHGADRINPDSDADGMSDGDEVYAGVDPADEASLFTAATREDLFEAHPVVEWASREDRTYRLERAADLLTDVFFSVQSGILATPPMNTSTDITATGEGPWFYRVIVE